MENKDLGNGPPPHPRATTYHIELANGKMTGVEADGLICKDKTFTFWLNGQIVITMPQDDVRTLMDCAFRVSET